MKHLMMRAILVVMVPVMESSCKYLYLCSPRELYLCPCEEMYLCSCGEL